MEDSDGTGRVASAGSCAAGMLCGVGWYYWMGTCLTVDAAHAPAGFRHGAYWAPGVLSTVGLLLLNMVSWEAVTDEGGLGDDGMATRAKCWVFFSFLVMFGGVSIALCARAPHLHALTTRTSAAHRGAVDHNRRPRPPGRQRLRREQWYAPAPERASRGLTRGSLGVAGVLIQNLCIFAAALLFRAVRRQGDHAV